MKQAYNSISQSCEARDFHPQAAGIMLQATGKMLKAMGKKYQQANKQAASMKHTGALYY